MGTRFVPKTEFNSDLSALEDRVETFIKEYYAEHNMGPTQEQIRDGLDIENDLVSYVITHMVKDGSKILKIQV